jgi:pimeloyl-ACP methyl ester carboxylesterase
VVLDKLGVERFTVVGHSMGGEVATALAEIKPNQVERMVLIDSPPAAGTRFTLLAQAYFTPVIGEALSHLQSDRVVRQGLQQGFAASFPVPQKFVEDFRQLTYTAAREAHDDSESFRANNPPYRRIAALKPLPPLLVIFGTEDAIVPPESAKLFEQVPGTKVAMIDGAGHSPMVETPAKVLELIRDFDRVPIAPQ